MEKYYVRDDGTFIGTFVGAEPPTDAIEVPTAPSDGRDTWNFETSQWIPFVPPVVYPQEVIIQSPGGVLVRVTADDNGEIYGEVVS